MNPLYLILLIFSLSACASVRPTTISDLPTQQWKPGIYDLKSGEKISEDELWRALKSAKYVLVGESHDSEKDHRVQLRAVEALMSAESLVGFEMFQRPFQNVLDAYSAGKISEEKMLAQSEWETRWGFELAFYSPIWKTAKAKKGNIVALNLRKELTKRISAKGIDGLLDLERADLPEVDLSNLTYKHWLEKIFSSHGAKMSEEKMQHFFEAQVLWDETMADSAVEAVNKRKADRLIAIVGRGHFEWDWGIPSRIRRRIQSGYSDGKVRVLIPSEGNLPKIDVLKEKRFADYIWVHE